MIDSARAARWLIFGHFILGGSFAVVWGAQTIVFAFVLSDFIRSNVVGKIGLVSSGLYSLLGILWVITGFLLQRGSRGGLIRGLAILAILLFPFGLILGVPTLVFAKRSAEPSAPPNGGPATPVGNSVVAKGPPSVS